MKNKLYIILASIILLLVVIALGVEDVDYVDATTGIEKKCLLWYGWTLNSKVHETEFALWARSLNLITDQPAKWRRTNSWRLIQKNNCYNYNGAEYEMKECVLVCKILEYNRIDCDRRELIQRQLARLDNYSNEYRSIPYYRMYYEERRKQKLESKQSTVNK